MIGVACKKSIKTKTEPMSPLESVGSIILYKIVPIIMFVNIIKRLPVIFSLRVSAILQRYIMFKRIITKGIIVKNIIYCISFVNSSLFDEFALESEHLM
jgi:hypothetical protein